MSGLYENAQSDDVFVQQMVAAESSGVLFTANFLIGARNEIVLSASWGLGEPIVGGSITPGHIVANKATDAIREVKIGNKAVMTTIEESRPSGVKPLIALTRASGSGRSRGGLRETSIKRTSKGAGWRKRFPTGRNGRR